MDLRRSGRDTLVVPAVPPEVTDFYASGREFGRLDNGDLAGPLEFERTIELFERFLPAGTLNVLDVGGGPGIYSQWLAQRGHSVCLVDPVERHVEAARELGVEARVGEAEGLVEGDATQDVVLLMGPLYHLVRKDDRLRALREALRVLRPGGLLIATAISRFAALFDQLIRLDRFHDPDETARIVEITRSGVLPAREGGVFTTAYMHLPRELQAEVSEATFESVTVVAIEGPGYLVSNFDERWSDSPRREAMLTAARLIEADPEMRAIGSHLMAIATRP